MWRVSEERAELQQQLHDLDAVGRLDNGVVDVSRRDRRQAADAALRALRTRHAGRTFGDELVRFRELDDVSTQRQRTHNDRELAEKRWPYNNNPGN